MLEQRARWPSMVFRGPSSAAHTDNRTSLISEESMSYKVYMPGMSPSAKKQASSYRFTER